MRRRGHEDIASKDTFLNGFAMVAAILVMVLHLINPPSAENDTTPPGNLIVTAVWPEGAVDIDLWVYGPGEELPIGFSNKTGKEWSLLRDDLGTRNDSMPVNMENSYSRAVKAGHYVINLHCYTCRTGPVPVAVEVRIANMNGGRSEALLTAKVTLTEHGQEITVVQFDLTAEGTIVPKSAHNVFTPLHKAWQ
jgi:hypothetical protein